MIEKINRSTLVKQVIIQMEEMIEKGIWKIGEKIPAEPELINKFDVSRNTLREGVQALVYGGLLEAKQGRGTIVKANNSLSLALEKKILRTSLLDTLEVRLGLERETAQLAAHRRTEDDLHQMKLYLETCKIAMETNDHLQFIKMDIAFHKAVVKATHNTLFIDMYESITDALQKSVDEIMKIHKYSYHKNHIHNDLFRAIKLKNSEMALKSVEQYMDDAKNTLSTLIYKLGE